jgi:hypothetical protein
MCGFRQIGNDFVEFEPGIGRLGQIHRIGHGQGKGRLAAVSAALQSRPQSHRDGFLKTKTLLRKRAARNFDAITKALGEICNLFSVTECRNYFKAAGYEAD